MELFVHSKFSRRLGKASPWLLSACALACSQTAAPAASPKGETALAKKRSVEQAAPKASSKKRAAPPIHSPASNKKAEPPQRELPPAYACGEHTCYRFSEAGNVLLPLVLHHRARLIAFGEAHAPAHYEGRSTVKRFTDGLLPSISGGSSYLLVELLQPPSVGCQEEKKAVKKESKKITRGQAKNNQNEYLALGNKAHSLGVIPDILHATCEDLALIASKEGGVVAMMEAIARLSRASLKKQLSSTKKGRPIVLAYGGALHNDVSPREGRESWSYGPALVETTQGAYLEVDLMIPELIGDSKSWKSFAWYEAYQGFDHQDGLVLMQWGERSYTLFFAPEAAKASDAAATK